MNLLQDLFGLTPTRNGDTILLTEEQAIDSQSHSRVIPIRRKVRFEHLCPYAKDVFLAGSFNNWDPSQIRMKQDEVGNWFVDVELQFGVYEYLYYVDGVWQCDKRAVEQIQNPFGTTNCIVRV